MPVDRARRPVLATNTPAGGRWDWTGRPHVKRVKRGKAGQPPGGNRLLDVLVSSWRIHDLSRVAEVHGHFQPGDVRVSARQRAAGVVGESAASQPARAPCPQTPPARVFPDDPTPRPTTPSLAEKTRCALSSRHSWLSPIRQAGHVQNRIGSVPGFALATAVARQVNIRQLQVTRPHTVKPMASGSSADTMVHLALPVSL